MFGPNVPKKKHRARLRRSRRAAGDGRVAIPCGSWLVLTNLVSNAMKFTERGEVVLNAAVQEQTPTHLVSAST